MQAMALEGGFADTPIEASRAFRQIMRVMACPGTIASVVGAKPPAPVSIAAGTVILTLCGQETPVFLAPSVDTPEVRDWITFHTSAPLVPADQAQIALGGWDELPLDAFCIGTAEYPDRSTTLIVETEHLEITGAALRGPGIASVAHLSLPETTAFQRNNALYPLGLDFFFASGDRLAALPRSTKVN